MSELGTGWKVSKLNFVLDDEKCVKTMMKLAQKYYDAIWRSFRLKKKSKNVPARTCVCVKWAATKLHTHTHTNGYVQLWKSIIILHHSILAHDERVTKKCKKKKATHRFVQIFPGNFTPWHDDHACMHVLTQFVGEEANNNELEKKRQRNKLKLCVPATAGGTEIPLHTKMQFLFRWEMTIGW